MAPSSFKNSEMKGNFNENANPCFKEQGLSYDCLNDNHYDASKCRVQFENYKACRSFWNQIRLERMRKGIEPYIPPIEERKKIIEERFPGKRVV